MTIDTRAWATVLDIDKYLYTWERLKSLPQPVDLIPGLLTDDLTCLIGRPFVGKTWLAYHIVAALLTGKLILDRQPVGDDHRVCIITTDPGTHRRVLARLEALGIGDAYADRVLVLYRYRIASLTEGPLLAVLETFKPTLVVIDNLSGSIRLDGDINQTDTNKTLDQIQNVADRYPVLLIHHTAKGFPGSSGKTPAGTYMIGGNVRRQILIQGSGDEPYRTLEIENNDSENEHLTVLLSGPSLAATEPRKPKSGKNANRGKPATDPMIRARQIMDDDKTRNSGNKTEAARLVAALNPDYAPKIETPSVKRKLDRELFGGRGPAYLVVDGGRFVHGPAWAD